MQDVKSQIIALCDSSAYRTDFGTEHKCCKHLYANTEDLAEFYKALNGM